MENGPILWGACTASASVACFFVRVWINRLGKDIEKMEQKLVMKLDAALCPERMATVKEIALGNCARNEEEHKEIYDRLRVVERRIP